MKHAALLTESEKEAIYRAVKRENDIRDAAFLNLTGNICGRPVVQITLRHWLILSAIDTPFACNRVPLAHEIAQFLWLLNPAFHPRKKIRRWMFIRSCRNLPAGECAAKCQQWWDDAFQDAPPGNPKAPKDQPLHFSFVASVIRSVHKSVGMTRNEILNAPMKELFQHMKIERICASGDASMEFNPSERVTGKIYHAALNRKN